MYAQQNVIDPSLAALLQTAKLVTPDGDDTVAAQVAQAAQQKLSPPTTPPGIGALMPGVRQQAVNAAQAAQPVTQAQVQQMMQQAGARSPSQGVAGLPADNMRTFTAAQGGVVGYAGKEGSYVDPQFPSVYENYVEPTREARTGREEDELFGPMKSERQRVIEAVAEELLGPMTKERLAAALPRPAPANRPSAPAPRPPTPPAARPPTPATRPPAAAPAPTGIAQLAVRPTYDTAGIAAAGAPYMTAGEGDVNRLREAEGKRAEFEKTLPDLSAKGIEALRQRMADVEGAEEQRKKMLPMDQAIAWLLGGKEGVGGSALAAQRFKAAQNAAADAFSQARLGNQQAQLLLEKAQQERQLGRVDRAIALEKEAAALMEKARDNALKAKDLAQRGAGAQFQGAVQMYEGEQNRDANRKLEEYRRQTQLMKPKEQDNVARLESMKLAELTGGKPESATPTQKLQALDFAIKTARGTGVDDRAEFAALRQQATMLRDELKLAMESDPLGKSPRIADLRARLDGIYKQLGGPAAGRTMTMADVQATAKASGKTVDEVKKAATAAGYTVQ